MMHFSMKTKVTQLLINKILQEQNKPIKYLIFAGGGAKGGVYSGVNKALIEYGILDGIDSISGSSIGSIEACLLACGTSKEQYYEISKNVNSQSLFGDQYFINQDGEPFVKLISSTINDNIYQYLNAHPQFLNSEKIKRIYEKVTSIVDISFEDLFNMQEIAPKKFKGLAITGMRKDNGKLQIFDYQNTPDLGIAKACRASISLPIIFKPYELYGVEYVDGGFKDLLPIKYFKDKDPEGRILAFAFGNNMKDWSNIAIYSTQSPITTYDLESSVVYPFSQYLSNIKGQEFIKNWENNYQVVRNNALNILPLGTAHIDVLSFEEAQEEAQYLYLKGFVQTSEYLKNHNLLSKDFDSNILDVKNLIVGICEEYLKKSYIESKINSLISCLNYIKNEFCGVEIYSPDMGSSQILRFAEDEYWNGKNSDEVLANFIKKTLTKKNGNLSIKTKLLIDLINILNDSYTPNRLKNQVISIIKSDKIDPNSETIDKDLIQLRFEPQDFIHFISENSQINNQIDLELLN